MEKQLDLRIQRTYKSLSNSFLTLMEEKHFEEITVQQLCDVAMIRRTTFYKHFADKDEFFAFYVRQIHTEFLQNIGEPLRCDNFFHYLAQTTQYLMDFFRKNERMVHSALESNMFPRIMDIMAEEITAEIMYHLAEDLRNGATLPVQPEIFVMFYYGALTSTLRWWFEQKCPIPEDALLSQLHQLLQPNILLINA